MAGEREQILELFREGKKLSTSHIVQAVYGAADSAEKKAVLHRKAIYHLNRLADEGILRVSGFLNKGEKLFEVAKELIVELPGSRIKLQAKNYELKNLESEKDLFLPYEPFGIMINSVLLDAAGLQLGQLRNLLKDLFKEVNDVIAIKNFDIKQSLESLQNFFSSIEGKLCIIVDFSSPAAYMLNKLIHAINNNVEIVMLAGEDELLDKNKAFNQLVDQLKDSGRKINVSNKTKKIHYPGSAGIYSVKDSNKFLQIASSNTILLDFEKIRGLSASALSKMLHKIAKSTHTVVVNQMLDVNSLFPVLAANNADFTKAKNYFRIWNYDWEKDQATLKLFEDLKEELTEFSVNQQNIYKSCGLPMDFKIGLSSGFNSYDRKNLSKRVYKKNLIKNYEDLMHNKPYLDYRRNLLSLFDNDRIRIFRHGNEDISREILYLLQRGFPLITYDYRALGQELNLRDFM